MQEPKELKNKHKTVARYLAMGLGLREICEMLMLNYGSWQQIVATPLFKHEINRVAQEIEERAIEAAVTDPVLLRIKSATLNAVNRLVNEVDNIDPESGASATSRIRAAESILDRCGYSTMKDDKPIGAVFIPVTQDKLDAIMAKSSIQAQPQSIQG